MTKRKNENLSSRPKVDVHDILKILACNIFLRKLLKLKWTQVSLPTAWGQDKKYFSYMI